MKIRNAKLGDVEQIYAIMRHVGRIAYTKDLIMDLMNSDNSICLALIENDKIVGTLGARSEGKNSYWLYYIVIKKEFRNRGYANELMNRFFNKAKNSGVKRIALDTPDKDFFEKFGFKEVGRLPSWHEDRDQIIMYQVLE